MGWTSGNFIRTMLSHLSKYLYICITDSDNSLPAYFSNSTYKQCLLLFDTRIVRSLNKTSMNKQTTRAIQDPTHKEKLTNEIDLRQLSESDIASLQKQDPFMYHSIPAVYKARLNLERIDHSTVVPSDTSNTSSVVTRKTRISTESYNESFLYTDLRADDPMSVEEFEVPAKNWWKAILDWSLFDFGPSLPCKYKKEVSATWRRTAKPWLMFVGNYVHKHEEWFHPDSA